MSAKLYWNTLSEVLGDSLSTEFILRPLQHFSATVFQALNSRHVAIAWVSPSR